MVLKLLIISPITTQSYSLFYRIYNTFKHCKAINLDYRSVSNMRYPYCALRTIWKDLKIELFSPFQIAWDLITIRQYLTSDLQQMYNKKLIGDKEAPIIFTVSNIVR